MENQCQPDNWKKDIDGHLSPTHQHKDGSWWWYDETWVDEIGPFVTCEQANESQRRYVIEYLNKVK